MRRFISAFHPSRGPNGSTYMTSDGTVYVRTPWGSRTLDSAVGPSVYGLQRAFVRAISRNRLVQVVIGVAGAVAGVILTLVLA